MKEKIIEILKSKIKIKSTVMTDYCDPHIKSDITGFEQAAQEISALLKGEGEYKNDIIQFVTNALYRAHDEDMKTLSPIEFDKWIEAQTEALPDKDAIIEKLNELNKLRKSYIVFLGEQLSDNAAFLKAHGIVCSETDFKIGAEYRKQIEHFELELANLKKQ